jgi:hypothetical protein
MINSEGKFFCGIKHAQHRFLRSVFLNSYISGSIGWWFKIMLLFNGLLSDSEFKIMLLFFINEIMP